MKWIDTFLVLALGCSAPESPAKPSPAVRATAANAAQTSASRAEPAVAAEAPVDDLIARGRELLQQGRATEAQALFEEAAARENQSLRTQSWVIQSWLAQGRINDSLDAIDVLERAGHQGPPIDYLYGMAFVAKARDYTARNVQGQIIQMSYVDAVGFLEKATKADPAAYADAFLPLAEAAWQMRELGIARSAADRAVEIEPENAEAALLRGRIALAQFAEENADPSRKESADASWEAARSSFEKAVALADRSTELALVADAQNQLGHTWTWKQKTDEAARAYAAAAALDPATVDFTQMLGALGPEKFRAALEEAAQAFAETPGRETTGDASLLWWLGYARFATQQYEQAEEAFLAAVAKVPSFHNSWWYTAIARHHRQDWAGSVDAIRTNWEANPEDLVASVSQAREIGLPIVTYLVGWCATQEPPHNTDAGLLCEVLANVEPENTDHWNNAGLFWRDAGERLVRQSTDAADKELARGYFEKAYAFYSRALELEPENPGFLNDTAVMLHYNLDRDLERALEMYKRATVNAEAELAKPDLAPDRIEWFQLALRDSKNNTKLLEALIARRKAAAEPNKEG